MLRSGIKPKTLSVAKETRGKEATGKDFEKRNGGGNGRGCAEKISAKGTSIDLGKGGFHRGVEGIGRATRRKHL